MTQLTQAAMKALNAAATEGEAEDTKSNFDWPSAVNTLLTKRPWKSLAAFKTDAAKASVLKALKVPGCDVLRLELDNGMPAMPSYEGDPEEYRATLRGTWTAYVLPMVRTEDRGFEAYCDDFRATIHADESDWKMQDEGGNNLRHDYTYSHDVTILALLRHDNEGNSVALDALVY